MFYTIYKITHKESGKKYIGKHQTKDLNDGYMGSGKYLKRAIEKYGLDNFTKEILHVFETEEEMNSKEAELVTEEFCKRNDTYNMCPGGNGGFGYINSNILVGDKRKEVNRKNIKNAMKKEVRLKATENTDYTKIGFSIMDKDKLRELANRTRKIHKGTKRSDETKQKMSLSGSGKNNSQFGTMWITNGIENKKIKKDLTIPKGWYKGRSTK